MIKHSKSVVIHKFGGYDVLKIEDYSLPDLKDKIEVEVYYCGLNFCDIYKRLGFFNKPLPFVMGSEACGVITDLGLKTDQFQIGDRVICYDFEEGMYRTILRTSPEKCFKIPDEIPMEDGAAIFLNYLTAYFALFELGGIKSGFNVFIKSCGGGFGCAATQLARTVKNVTIYGTVSKGKEQEVQQNGVNFVYNNESDYLNEAKKDCPEGFDLILDNESGSWLNEGCKVLKFFGKIVVLSANSMINNPNSISLFSKLKLFVGVLSFQLSSLMNKSNSVCGLHTGNLVRENRKRVLECLNVIFDLYKNGEIKPKIDSIWPMEEVVQASKVLGERRNVGKVLLKMRN
nr:synaptic vesicle membrane protein VAT-1 homolog [Onthophagus taurus]